LYDLRYILTLALCAVDLESLIQSAKNPNAIAVLEKLQDHATKFNYNVCQAAYYCEDNL